MADRIRFDAGGRWLGSHGCPPQGRDQRDDVSQLVEEAWWPDVLGDEATAPARGREQKTEADFRRPVVEKSHAAAGSANKKALRLDRKPSLATSRTVRLMTTYPVLIGNGVLTQYAG